MTRPRARTREGNSGAFWSWTLYYERRKYGLNSRSTCTEGQDYGIGIVVFVIRTNTGAGYTRCLRHFACMLSAGAHSHGADGR